MAIVRSAALVALICAAGAPPAALAQGCVPNPASDWIAGVPASTSSVQVRPWDCATVEQTPPDFSWPDYGADARYTVTLTYPDGSTRSLAAPLNWINWDEALPPGDYAWRVQVESAGTLLESKARRFSVSANAVAFVVPPVDTLFQRAVAKPHPRALPDAATLQEMLDARQPELARLYARVDAGRHAPLPAEPTGGAEAVTALAVEESRRMLEAAFAWIAARNAGYASEALRRAQNLAGWDPHGSTSYAAADVAAAALLRSLALAYDWLYPQLDENQRSLLRASILTRASDLYHDLVGGRARLARHPYDSHGNANLTPLALVCVLVAGDIPEAYAGLRDTLPLALHWTTPWGEEDGGYGNGTAYSYWDIGDRLLPWYALRWAVGVDLAQRAWVRNHARFVAYFVPPGSPSGVFGDGAELPPDPEGWARLAKSYAGFAPQPLMRWYTGQLAGEDGSRLELLLAPLAAGGAAPLPADAADAAYFPSIGWSAMHSALADPARVSVYFKASRYASYNHSHADQASFVVNAGGQPLAVDSGHYDGYQTPHWWQWYKQTRAHNAVTFDGGMGQVVYEDGNRYGPGRVTHFEHRAEYDIVQADATPAYGGALAEARRALVYLRPDRILVYDRLASAFARRWEWNIHALQAIDAVSDRSVQIARGGERLCVDLLAGPETRFVQTDRWSAEPASGARQWHGTFYSVTPGPEAEFIALLRVGCAPLQASAVKQDAAWTVQLATTTVTIDGSGAITVR